MHTQTPRDIAIAIETFGEVPESLVATQLDGFLAAREDMLHFEELYGNVYSESQFLLGVDSSKIADDTTRDKLEFVQSLYRGNGGV